MESRSTINFLASSLGKRSEIPNQELAKRISADNDKTAIAELIENLSNKNKHIVNDCLKVIYEVAAVRPALVATHFNELVPLLKTKNNRLQWGIMITLSALTEKEPELIYTHLSEIISAAEKGSVITKDNYVKILATLCRNKKYEGVFPLLNEMILKSPANQLPMYAEIAIPAITPENKTLFLKTLNSRLKETEKESQRKRIEKVIKKFS